MPDIKWGAWEMQVHTPDVHKAENAFRICTALEAFEVQPSSYDSAHYNHNRTLLMGSHCIRLAVSRLWM